MRCVSDKKTQATHIPKSAIMIYDDGSLVQERMFSGLFTSHALDPNILPKMGRGMKRERATYLRSRWTMLWSCRYFTPDRTELGIKRSPSVSRCYPVDEQSNVPRHCYGISF